MTRDLHEPAGADRVVVDGRTWERAHAELGGWVWRCVDGGERVFSHTESRYLDRIAALEAALASAREENERLRPDALRWRAASPIARLETDTGDVALTITLGSTENVERCNGSWPDTVRDALLRGAEIWEEDDVTAIYDHAMRQMIELEASKALASSAPNAEPGGGTE